MVNIIMLQYNRELVTGVWCNCHRGILKYLRPTFNYVR